MIHDLTINTIKGIYNRVVTQLPILVQSGLISNSGMQRIKTSPQSISTIILLGTLIKGIMAIFPQTYHEFNSTLTNINLLVTELNDLNTSGSDRVIKIRQVMYKINEEVRKSLAYFLGLYSGVQAYDEGFSKIHNDKNSGLAKLFDSTQTANILSEDNIKRLSANISLMRSPSLQKYRGTTDYNTGISTANRYRVSMAHEYVTRS